MIATKFTQTSFPPATFINHTHVLDQFSNSAETSVSPRSGVISGCRSLANYAICSTRFGIVSAWGCAFLLVVAAFLGWTWWRSRIRATEIRRLAEVTGFHYLDETLPRSLPLRDSSLPTISSVWNVIDGERRGRRVIAFDCRFGEGKGSWRRTVLAVETDITGITASSFDPDMGVVQIGGWTFLYRPQHLALINRQLTPVTELAAYLDTI